MYYLYVDESGDPGLVNSPGRYFVLTGLVIHETRWRIILDDLIAFRRRLRTDFGLKLREEIHAAAFVQESNPLPGTSKRVKLYILRQCIDWLASRTDVHVITVVVDKQNKPANYKVFEYAWDTIIQRFENTIQNKNFPGGFADQRGMIVPDRTDVKKLTGLLRKMRRFNTIPSQQQYAQYVPYRNLVLQNVIEDPFYKDSVNSLITQMVDVVAYFARQQFEPNTKVKKIWSQGILYQASPGYKQAHWRGAAALHETPVKHGGSLSTAPYGSYLRGGWADERPVRTRTNKRLFFEKSSVYSEKAGTWLES